MDEVFIAIDTNLNVLGFSCIMPNGVSNQVDQHLPQLLFIKLNLSLIGDAVINLIFDIGQIFNDKTF